ncbi:MAG TPA: VWA domain-containing protein [Capsulimonadaceae bacterium]|jgi:uncharacterized protein YegL
MAQVIYDQDTIEFAENPEPRCPCVLLLDTSGSMQGSPIVALNDGIGLFVKAISKDPLAARRVDVALVTFDNAVNVVQPFISVSRFMPPRLTASGETSMGPAIHKALDMIADRRDVYAKNGIASFSPWVLMITDGELHGEMNELALKAAKRIKAAEESRQLAFYAVGVQNANMDRLAELVVRKPLKLSGLDFTKMFLWLSASIQMATHSVDANRIQSPSNTEL